MMKNKKGFTLIELLVVILIIGILAAIALPQYLVATKVARIKGLYPVMRAIVEARTNYYLLHENFTVNMDELDVDVSYNRKAGNTYYTDWGWFRLPYSAGDGYGGMVRFSVSSANVEIEFQYGHQTNAYGKMNNGTCNAPTEDSIANKICKQLGEYRTHNSSQNIYLFK